MLGEKNSRLSTYVHTTSHLPLAPLFFGQYMYSLTVSEIKLLFCALAGCTSHKTVHPEIYLCTLPIYTNNTWLKKRAHTGCTPPKIVHPAMEMCTPGAGCTLNFGHLTKININ